MIHRVTRSFQWAKNTLNLFWLEMFQPRFKETAGIVSQSGRVKGICFLDMSNFFSEINGGGAFSGLHTPLHYIQAMSNFIDKVKITMVATILHEKMPEDV